MILAFLQHAEQHYRKGGELTAEVRCFKSALKPVRELYGLTRVDDFGPPALRAVRDQYIANGWCRKYVNKAVLRVRLVFRWGVEHEIVSYATLASLKTVAALREGRTSAPDHPTREPVLQQDIEAVKAESRKQQTRDLMDLQLLTAARSGELLSLTTTMIDRSGDVWKASIIDHKTARHGGNRTLYFGPKAQLILVRYRNPKQPDAKLFTIRGDTYSAAGMRPGRGASIGTAPVATHGGDAASRGVRPGSRASDARTQQGRHDTVIRQAK